MAQFDITFVDTEYKPWTLKNGPAAGQEMHTYKVDAKGPDGETKRYEINRKPTSGPPKLGPVEAEVQPSNGNFPDKLKLSPQGGGGGFSGRKDDRGPEWFAQKDRRLARAGIVQAIVSGFPPPPVKEWADDKVNSWLDQVDVLADLLLKRLDQHAPSPNNGIGGGDASNPGMASQSVSPGPASVAPSGVATPAEKGATSRKLNELNVAPAIQTQLVHAVAGNPPTAEGLKVIEAAIALGDWASLFDERGVPRPPHLPDTRGLEPMVVGPDDGTTPF